MARIASSEAKCRSEVPKHRNCRSQPEASAEEAQELPKRQFEGRVEQRRPAEGGARQLSEAGAFPGYEDVVARVLHVTRKGAQRALENVQGLRAKILLERERRAALPSIDRWQRPP